MAAALEQTPRTVNPISAGITIGLTTGLVGFIVGATLLPHDEYLQNSLIAISASCATLGFLAGTICATANQLQGRSCCWFNNTSNPVGPNFSQLREESSSP